METISRYIVCSAQECFRPATREWVANEEVRIGDGEFRCDHHPVARGIPEDTLREFYGIFMHVHDDGLWKVTCAACRTCDHSQKTCSSCDWLPIWTIDELNDLVTELKDI